MRVCFKKEVDMKERILFFDNVFVKIFIWLLILICVSVYFIDKLYNFFKGIS